MRTIETLGTFWLPKNKKEKVRGKLFFSKETGISLELEGALLADSILSCDIILGENHAGEKYSLISCYLSNVSTSVSFERKKYTKNTKFIANKLLSGSHFNRLEALSFQSLKFRCSNLEKWVWANNFKWDYDETVEKLFAVTYGFKLYEPAILQDKTTVEVVTQAPRIHNEIA